MLDLSHVSTSEVHAPPVRVVSKARLQGLPAYEKLYRQSIEQNEQFWREQALEFVEWFHPFNRVRSGDFGAGDIAWFLNGKLNVCYNCVDRHAAKSPQRTAFIWEGDEEKDIKRVSYKELLSLVCKFANVLKKHGVRKGDSVCIYLPMIVEAAVAMLACARIGAPHSVVFAGFSSEALHDRVVDAHAKYVITADEGIRAGKKIPLKSMTDVAIKDIPFVKKVIVYKHTKSHDIPWNSSRDVWWHEEMETVRPYCPCEWMDSEDPLFYLYTSGSTGKPKGIQHTTGGYLLYAAITTAYTFDVHEDDVYACMADIGWVTGHSYILYGPLCLGATSLLFESTPLHPDAGRYWSMVQRHKINIFYTAPTAIRALMKYGPEIVKKYDRSSLRILGSVGEPINPEAWKWYYEVVGDSNVAIVDTFWQTETGGHMITPLPGVTPMKPGSATLPFFGVQPVVLEHDGKLQEGNDKSGVLCFSLPWPGQARTIFGDHQRFINTYFASYPGLYFTGDGCYRDKDGYYWITGRVDDVMNVSGHRIGSAEIESALIEHHGVAESAVVGIPHELKGQALFCFVTLKHGVEASHHVVNELKSTVRKVVGAFAVPDVVLLTPVLPKTRSGKIMRRLLRKIACNETESLGDISTLADADVVKKLIADVQELRAHQHQHDNKPPAASSSSCSSSSSAAATK